LIHSLTGEGMHYALASAIGLFKHFMTQVDYEELMAPFLSEIAT
jgi:hypothetical protein